MPGRRTDGRDISLSDSAVTSPAGGPSGWENWQAFNSGFQTSQAFEVTCYTDAHITGEIAQIGSYAFLNPVAISSGIGVPVPGVVIRVDVHSDGNSDPDLSATDYSRYHGGGLDDELAALLSLALGIRLRSGGVTRVYWDGSTRGKPLLIGHQMPHLEPPASRHGSMLPDVNEKSCWTTRFRPSSSIPH